MRDDEEEDQARGGDAKTTKRRRGLGRRGLRFLPLDKRVDDRRPCVRERVSGSCAKKREKKSYKRRPRSTPRGP